MADQVEVTTVPKLGFWGSIRSFFAGISSRIWSAFLPFLKTEAAKFIAEAQPILIAAIKAAQSTEGTGAQKRDAALGYVKQQLAAQGKTIGESLINVGIEVTLQVIKEELAKKDN